MVLIVVIIGFGFVTILFRTPVALKCKQDLEWSRCTVQVLMSVCHWILLLIRLLISRRVNFCALQKKVQIFCIFPFSASFMYQKCFNKLDVVDFLMFFFAFASCHIENGHFLDIHNCKRAEFYRHMNAKREMSLILKKVWK